MPDEPLMSSAQCAPRPLTKAQIAFAQALAEALAERWAKQTAQPLPIATGSPDRISQEG